MVKLKKKALQELSDLIKIQISFAIQKKQLSLIWFPAEPKYFVLYERLKEKYFKTLKQDKNYEVDDLIISEKNIPHSTEKKIYAKSLQI